MVTKLEKQFFKTFGIEPNLTLYNLIKVKGNDTNKYSTRCSANYNNESKEETIRRHSSNGWKVIKCEDIYTYPQITDHILLKLICIANSQNIGFEGDNIEDIKKDLLDNFIFFKRDVYDQIHNLFKEVE